MRVWTIKNKSELNLLNSTGVYKANKEHLVQCWGDDSNFLQAYQWLNNYLKEHHNFKNDSCTWVWKKRPDLRFDRFGYKKGITYYLLEIEVEDVIFTCFDAWHAVLNNCSFPSFEDVKNKEKTWPRIFSHHPFWQDNKDTDFGTTWQGHLDQIEKSQIISITPFKGGSDKACT